MIESLPWNGMKFSAQCVSRLRDPVRSASTVQDRDRKHVQA